MIKPLSLILIGSILFSSSGYNGSTLAPVILSGSIIKHKHVDENVQKYKRKDCPVCKGKGWYMSGDGISKVPCGYCEPDETSISPTQTTIKCENNKCSTTIIRSR